MATRIPDAASYHTLPSSDVFSASDIIEALANNHIPQLKKMLTAGAIPRDALQKCFNYRANPDPEVVSILLEGGADPNVYIHGNTPLLITARQNNSILAELLLNAGADPNLACEFQITPLMAASTHAETDLVEKFLSMGVDDIDQTDIVGESALFKAAAAGCTANVQVLLDAGADPLFCKKNCESALMEAIRKEHVEVASLLIAFQASHSQVDPETNLPPQHLAYVLGETALLEQLQGDGFEFDFGQFEEFMAAVSDGNLSKMRELIGEGVELDLPDQTWVTPLQRAVLNANPKATELLIDSGADVNLVYSLSVLSSVSRQATPFVLSVEAGCCEITRMLLDRGATPCNPSHIFREAAKQETPEMLEIVLGSFPEGASTEDLDSALTCAAQSEREENLRFLVAAGANPNAHGHSAYRVAISSGNPEIIAVFDEFEMDFRGNTSILKMAVEEKNWDWYRNMREKGCRFNFSILLPVSRYSTPIPSLSSRYFFIEKAFADAPIDIVKDMIEDELPIYDDLLMSNNTSCLAIALELRRLDIVQAIRAQKEKETGSCILL